MYILCLFEAVYISLVLTLGKKGLECWACPAGTRYFYSALAALIVGPVQNDVFLTVHYFDSFFPIAQPAGQAAMRGRLSLLMCLW